MQLKNTPAAYGAVTKALHWIMGLLMIFMLALGLFMENSEPLTFKLKLYNLHKSLGVTILFLVTLRILWHITSKKPDFVAGLQPWEKLAATVMHWFLYAGMIGMPMSGWLLSSAAGRSVEFFGLFALPDLIAPDDNLRGIFGAVHYFFGMALIAGIGCHAAAAIKHHVMNKDATLRRMLPVIVAALLLSSPALAAAPQWDIDPAASKITFTGKVMNKDFSGTFKSFTADIAFDPDKPDTSTIRADIDVTSIDSGDKERDGTTQTAEWFNPTAFPKAVFESTAIRKKDDGSFEADGKLTIKETTKAVTLPFTLTRAIADSGKEAAVVSGSVMLDRSQFGLGTGEWTDQSTVANPVRVDIHLTATRRQ
jgi:cytochrome b561/polyisoprenoid-binding protein YceI